MLAFNMHVNECYWGVAWYFFSNAIPICQKMKSKYHFPGMAEMWPWGRAKALSNDPSCSMPYYSFIYYTIYFQILYHIISLMIYLLINVGKYLKQVLELSFLGDTRSSQISDLLKNVIS